MKNKRQVDLAAIFVLVIILLLTAGIAYFLFFYRDGFEHFVIENSYYNLEGTSNVDVIGALITTYSIFITAVLFILGVPIAIFSYNTRKDSREIQKDTRRFLDDINEKVRPIQNEINENKALEKVDDIYDEDPNELREKNGKKALKEFAVSFRKTHHNEVKKFFYQAKYIMRDNETVYINNIGKEISLYRDDIQNTIDAIGYLVRCEQTISTEIVENGGNGISRYDIYRELSNAYKNLGVYFNDHNKVLSLDYLLKALEYCQKAINDTPRYMLAYNNKSNILKDISRLFLDSKNIKESLVKRMKIKLRGLEESVFDFKQIENYIDQKLQESDYGEIFSRRDKKIELFACMSCQKGNCSNCEWTCDEYLEVVDKMKDEEILKIILLESMICIERKVLGEKPSYFLEDTSEKQVRRQQCYYNCAISYFMLFKYMGKKPSNFNSDPLYKEFKAKLINAFEENQSKNRSAIRKEINEDRDLLILFDKDESATAPDIKYFAKLKKDIEKDIEENLKTKFDKMLDIIKKG